MNQDPAVSPPRQFTVPVARAGYPLIFSAAFLAVVFAWFGLTILAVVSFLSALFICYFFRDPKRAIPENAGAVVAPADGRIIEARQIENGPFPEGGCFKVSIFMSVFNVHVNRIPFDGNVKDVKHRPGKFVSAYREKASKQNEQNSVFLETSDGLNICVVQVAGLIARRILCRVSAGDSVARGQRFGMICFGSRVDIYLPEKADVHVAVGNRVKAGTSILGYL